MEQLEILFAQFKQDKDIKKFIDANVTFDSEIIQSYVQSLPEENRKDFQDTLSEIMEALQVHIENLTKDRDEIKAQIDGSVKSEKACLSYGSTQGLTNKKRE